jgi:uncharacterized phage infection (PIP) family protein YhgE
LEAKQGLQKRTVELEESLQRAIGEVEQLTGEVSGQMEAKEALQKHIGELEENLEGAVQELEHLRGEVSHFEEANVGLQRHVEELEESLQKAVGGLATVAALEAQVTQLQSAYDEQGVRYDSELERLTQLMEAERQKAEEALQQMSRANATAAEILQSEVAQLTKQLSSTQNHRLQVCFVLLLFPLLCATYYEDGEIYLPTHSSSQRNACVGGLLQMYRSITAVDADQ